MRTRLARAAGQAEVARAAEADQSARLGVGVWWTREARVAELVGPGGAQRARAAGGAAPKLALHTQAVTSVEDGGEVAFPAQAAHAALPAAGL